MRKDTPVPGAPELSKSLSLGSALLPIETLREFTKPMAALNVFWIVSTYVLIVGAIWLGVRFFHPAFYVLVVLFVGARQQALGVLMHDAVHFQLFRNRHLNDFVGQYLLGWPIQLSMYGFRRTHLAHHRDLLTNQDPDLPRISRPDYRPGQLLRIFAFHITGLRALEIAKDQFRASTPKTRVFLVALYLAVIAGLAFSATARLFAAFYIVPLVTWAPTGGMIRAFGEHYVVDRTHPLFRADVVFRTRVVIPSLLERIFVCPFNINYHLPHHLYPGVPQHRLPALHRLLMQSVEYRKRAHVSHGYIEVVRESFGHLQPSVR